MLRDRLGQRGWWDRPEGKGLLGRWERRVCRELLDRKGWQELRGPRGRLGRLGRWVLLEWRGWCFGGLILRASIMGWGMRWLIWGRVMFRWWGIMRGRFLWVRLLVGRCWRRVVLWERWGLVVRLDLLGQWEQLA